MEDLESERKRIIAMHVDRDIFKNALDAIIIVDESGLILEINPSAKELINKHRTRLTGKNLDSFFEGNLSKKRGEVGLKGTENILQYTKADGSARGTQLFFFRDITDLKQEMLRREHFLGIAGHELKNPLAGIKALDHMILALPAVKKDQFLSDQIKKIDLKADTLSRLIRELLDITKIKQDALSLTIERVNFKQILEEVIEDFGRINSTHRVIAHIKANAILQIDRERVMQVIINLLKNAAKYSPSADHIFVNVKKTKKYLICEVIDFGIGIPEDQTKKLFNLYYRLPGQKRTFAGLGVGLYIAQGLAKAHGGYIKVKSQVGKGSQFNFYLPLKSKLKNGKHTFYRN